MTRKRGRALIINNKNFDERPDLCRQGSDVDVENMSVMLKDFKFDVMTHTDLKAEVLHGAKILFVLMVNNIFLDIIRTVYCDFVLVPCNSYYLII